MKRFIFLLTFLFVSIIGYTQSRYYLRADSIYIEKGGGNGELILLNSTRDSTGGILYNKGKGRTGFKKSRVLNDSTFTIGGDTITIRGTGGNLQQVTDRGSKTIDTVAVGGVRTKHILTDTTNKPTFRIILKPDTQNEVRYSWPYQLDSVAKWIRDSASYYNTKAFLGLGDITDLGNDTEFSRMDSFYRHIDTAGLAYMAILGNHDYDNASSPNISGRVSTRFNTYFGPSRFSGKSFYGGNLGGKNDNYYTKFEAEGHKYLVIGLEYNPHDSALNWAQRVCDTFPDRETIIITHAYITAWNEKSVDTSQFTSTYGDIGNNGQEIWDKFLKRNKQIFLVAGGHYIPGAQNLPAFGRIFQAGSNGNVVTQVLIDCQSDTLDGYASGMGFLMTLDFNLQQGKIDFNVYSPFLKKYHPAFRPFSINYPAINIEASTGVSSVNGNFNVAGEVRFDSATFVTQLTKNRLMVTGKNGQLDTLDNVAANSFLTSTGVNTRPRYRTLLSTDMPVGSGNYIQNQIAAGQVSNFWAMNTNFPDFTGVGVVSKTATYRPGLTSGVPQTLIVAHAGSNYGLGIQRASANTLPAHLSFFHNNAADFTTLVANSVGDQVGSISWHVVANSLGIAIPVSLNAYVERNDGTSLTAGLVFNTRDSSNVIRSAFLNGSGNLLLGGTSPANPYKLYVKGSAAFDLGSDASYDMYYRNSSGSFTRLAAGTDGYKLTTHGITSDPTWEPSSASIASINSQTGPAITLTGGIGTYTSAPSANTIAYNVDATSDIFTRTIDAIMTTASNTGTSETDLYSKSVAGNTLNTDKQTLNFEADGEFNDNTATAQLKLYFGGNITLNTGAINISTAPTAWRLRGYIIRTSSSTAHVTYELQCPGLATPLFLGYSNLTSLDFTTTNIIKITAQAGGAGGGNSDITAHSWQITYKPQP
jgi:hypothetical protein